MFLPLILGKGPRHKNTQKERHGGDSAPVGGLKHVQEPVTVAQLADQLNSASVCVAMSYSRCGDVTLLPQSHCRNSQDEEEAGWDRGGEGWEEELE